MSKLPCFFKRRAFKHRFSYNFLKKYGEDTGMSTNIFFCKYATLKQVNSCRIYVDHIQQKYFSITFNESFSLLSPLPSVH